MKKIADYIALVLTLYGLYQLYAELYKKFNSFYALAIVSLLIIVLILGFELYKKYNLPFVFRFFRIKPNKGIITTATSNKITIMPDGTSTNQITKTYLFTESPNPEQLYNTFFALSTFSNDINSIVKYHGARVRKFNISRKGKLVVYWEPLKKIDLNIPYSHKYEWYMPSKLNDDRNFFVIFMLNATGIVSIDINSSREIENAWIIKKPRMYFRKLNEDNIERIIHRKNNFEIEQPKIKNNTIKWKCVSLKHHNAYILYFTHKHEAQ